MASAAGTLRVDQAPSWRVVAEVLVADAAPRCARMWRPQALIGVALLVGLALYATDGRDRLLAQENARLRASLAASVKAEAVAARASESKVRELEQENELLRAQLNESAAAAAATVGGANGEAKRKLLADRTDWFTKTALCPKPIRTLKKKGEIPFVLQEEGMRVGVEVGVFRGGFSNWVLSNWPACTKYYMVDLWSAQDNYRQMDNATTSKNLERMEEARRNVASFGTKAVLVRKPSVEAAAQFEDASIDFVYIDARHTYDAVMEDLEAWWPKVRPGGIVAGEDYMDAEEVWRMTATCDWEGIGGGGFPWVGCTKWTLPYGQVSE